MLIRHVRALMNEQMKYIPLLCVLAAMGVTAAHAQSYPNRTIRMIVPFPAGGVTEFAAFQKSEIAKWANVVKASGARID